MRVIQLSKNNHTISLPNNSKIIHIGMEHLHSTPLTENDSFGNEDKMFKVIINGQNYYINKCDILEYDNLNWENFSISTTDWDNFTFVNIGYE